jgi:ribonucleoside-diphosphate reductase alpha chain
MKKAITIESAIEKSKQYFKGDELAATVFPTKYALTDKEGNLHEETPDDMHHRMAKEFARIEANYKNPLTEKEIYSLFSSWEVVPQGSPMSGVGNPFQVQSLSNCFVIDSPEDSYAGILHTDQQQVQIMKRRGGVGFDISNIRPKGLATSNAARTTDGLGIFMERFSNSTREVAQGGRRGALMISIDIRHPEIETFINIKRDLTKVTGANISIRLNNEFMNAVKNDDEFQLQWPVESDNPTITKIIRATEIWDQIIDSAHQMAEPGIFFWDNVLNNSIPDCYADLGFKTVSSNPCGEIVLSPKDSCRLMVVNLAKFVQKPFTQHARFNWQKFSETVQKAQRLMDDLVDLEVEQVDKIINKIQNDPESQSVKIIELDLWKGIKEQALKGRRTGLGVTAVGDTLAMLNQQYGSDKSVKTIEKIYKHLGINSHISSCVMAGERGPFPIFSHVREKDHQYLDRLLKADDGLNKLYKQNGRRNIALTTTAPAGSVSTLTQTTSGIEPAFMLKYTRRRKITHTENVEANFIDAMGDKWVEYDVYHHGVKQWIEVTGNSNIEESPYWGSTANDLDWKQRVKIQAVAQKWIDHSISSTCNLPEDATPEDVREIYESAWESGCKGFTVYREGSRSGVLIDKSKQKSNNRFSSHSSPKRPEELECEIQHASIQGEQWTILVGLMDGKPYELLGGLSEYITIPSKYKSGKIVKHQRKTMNSIYDLHFGENGDEIIIKNIVKVFDNPNHASFTRVISLGLRHGAPVNYMVEQLQKDRDADMFSFSKVIARTLKRYIQDGTKSSEKKCDNCGAEGTMIFQEGCVSCTSCGNGKCG